MSLESDLLVDRRSLRRKLSAWRVVAFLAIAGLLILGLGANGLRDSLDERASHIARVEVSGFIGDQTETLKLLDRIGESGAKGVIVKINSPGGATTGGEALYNGLRKLAQQKPTVAVIDGLGASAAYMAAVATDHIVARRSALVGSIGVLVEYPNFSRLLDTVGVKVEAVKSSPLKASPDGVTPTPPEATAALNDLIQDTFAWFKGLVKDRRHFDDAALARVSDGRVFTGGQALGLKLVDEVGDESEAIAWMEGQRGVPKDLPVRTWERPKQGGFLGLGSEALAGLADGLGLHGAAAFLASATPAPTLDGLVSVWHP